MEPISPNLAALPGTVLESFGPSAMEVGQARLGDEMKMVAAAQKAKIEERAAAAKAAREAMKLPDFGTVGIPHEQQYAQLINDYLDFGAQAERMAATNPGNPEYDVSNPFSTVGRQKAAKEYQIKQAAAMSEEKSKAYYQFLKDFETGKYTNRDMEAMKEWYERPLVFGQDNSVTYDPMPTLLGAFDKMAFLASNFEKLKADKLARASAGGGYIDESTVTQLTPEDVEAGAISMAAPGQRNQLVTQYTYELEEMQKSNPKAYQEIEAAAKKKGITPIQEQAARDSRIFAYKQQTAAKKSDPTFTSGMGTGWMQNEAVADRWLDLMSGVSTGDPKIVKNKYGEVTPMAPGEVVKVPVKESYIREIRGTKIGSVKTMTGKDVDERISDVTIGDGVVEVRTMRDDKKPGRTYTYKQKDFQSEFAEQLLDNNPGFERTAFYKKAVEKGMYGRSGYLQPKAAPAGFADDILESEEGMMD